MFYALHGVPIQFESHDARLTARWHRQWAPFASAPVVSSAPIVVRLEVALALPPPPAEAVVSEGPFVAYHRSGDRLVLYLPRWGRCDIHLAANIVEGRLLESCFEAYGVFEDVVIMALAPLLRRRGLFTIHAFAAARQGRAAILAGDIGAGKTTTGLALLLAGYRLCANDSPLLRLKADGGVDVLAYPGLLSAYPDSLSRFPALAGLLAELPPDRPPAKLSFALDAIRPEAWQYEAQPGALFFPRVVPGLAASTLFPLDRFEALRRLIAHAVERWDTATIPTHLQALRRLVESCPAYELHLAPDIERLPALLTAAMDG
ncbi:MAG: hypothetical protein N2383_04695 [Caldilineales bacterium]|nr:hypothetical protein [Caldilineales bacterium]